MTFIAIRILLIFLSANIFVHLTLARNVKDRMQVSSSLDKLVDVGGGRRLHINCAGMHTTSGPTIILESGFGSPASVWNRVQPEVAKFARVCSYDRAGLGTSEPVPAPRTFVQVAEDLHSLLVNAKVPGPYILVGTRWGACWPDSMPVTTRQI